MKLKETLKVQAIIEGFTKYGKAEKTDEAFAEVATAMLGKRISVLSIARLRKAMGIQCLKKARVQKPKKMSRLENLEMKVAEIALMLAEMMSKSMVSSVTNGSHNRLEDVVGVR